VTSTEEVALKRGIDESRKLRYHKRVQEYGGHKLTLWSLDGLTWSTNKDELMTIIDRQDEAHARFGGQIRGGQQAGKQQGGKTGEANSEKQVTAPQRSLKVTREVIGIQMPDMDFHSDEASSRDSAAKKGGTSKSSFNKPAVKAQPQPKSVAKPTELTAKATAANTPKSGAAKATPSNNKSNAVKAKSPSTTTSQSAKGKPKTTKVVATSKQAKPAPKATPAKSTASSKTASKVSTKKETKPIAKQKTATVKPAVKNKSAATPAKKKVSKK
jgi:hypothetical protein